MYEKKRLCIFNVSKRLRLMGHLHNKAYNNFKISGKMYDFGARKWIYTQPLF